MKTALILGISGGFGGQMAKALMQSGWRIKGLLRQAATTSILPGIEIIEGDAADIQSVRSAAQGVDVLVYGVNPANYNWDSKALPWLDVAATVAQEQKLTLVFPGNVYIFDPKDGPVYSETSPKKAFHPKAQIRLAMEQRLQHAANQGAKVIVFRMGDFISTSGSAWTSFLIKPHSRGTAFVVAGKKDILHTWAYLPDACQAISRVLEKSAELPAYAEFNFEGHRVSLNEFIQTIQQTTGKPVVVKKFPWFAARLLSPFSKLFKGLMETRYLWQNEVSLDGGKLQDLIGEVPHTSLEQAIKQSGLLEHINVGKAGTSKQVTVT